MKWFLKTVIKRLTSCGKWEPGSAIQGNEAVICGVKTLHGAAVQAQELRGGAALILAALGAKGVTVLEGYSFVQRGYEHICQDLNALGAAVKRIQE